ncbi:MAG: FecR domain-containing protein [Alteraurantiacibacter sp.]
MQICFKAILTAVIVLSAVFANPHDAMAQADDAHLVYRMERGDTLTSVARRFLAAPNAIRAVARINRVRNDRRIPIGYALRLPRDLLAFRPADLRVRHFSGQVSVGGAAPQLGAIVTEGTEIRTGASGFLTLQDAGGATFALPSQSRARLEKARIYRLRDIRDVEFRILGGRGRVEVPPLREGERFRTSTPVAVTAVRGTIYRVAYDEPSGLGITEVVEGSVSVEQPNDTQLTEEGFGVVAAAQGVGEPEPMLPPVDIEDPGAIQTAETVAFFLNLPDSAVGARTQIATDAGFLEIVAEDIGGDNLAEFTQMPDARYFVRARAISRTGIEGLSETFSFRRKRLGASASVEPSPLGDGYRFAWLPQGDGITHFAFQLWREGEVGQPLYDEIALPGTATVVSGLDVGTYVWRVAAIQADAEDGLLKVWGPEQTLTVAPE